MNIEITDNYCMNFGLQFNKSGSGHYGTQIRQNVTADDAEEVYFSAQLSMMSLCFLLREGKKNSVPLAYCWKLQSTNFPHHFEYSSNLIDDWLAYAFSDDVAAHVLCPWHFLSTGAAAVHISNSITGSQFMAHRSEFRK